MRVVNQSVEHLASTGNAMRLIELAGRTCYKSEAKITDESAERFVRMIVGRGHDSVLEHASATFRIITDRGISHEIVRHRIGMSYSQESTRYVKYDGDMEFVMPDFPHPGDYYPWERSCTGSEDEYRELVESGVKPQWARSVLPNSLKTEIVATGNFRAWRHFLKLRTSKAAHPQIREVAGFVKKWFCENYPIIVEDLQP